MRRKHFLFTRVIAALCLFAHYDLVSTSTVVAGK